MTSIVTDCRLEFYRQLILFIDAKSDEAIRNNGIFKIGVAGGSMVEYVTSLINALKTDITKWKIFLCDERMVPLDSPYSTLGAYLKQINIIRKEEGMDLRDEQFVHVKQGVSAEDAADDYIKKMEIYFPKESLPKFDMLLLGIGPDGHICSLFPKHPLLQEKNVWIAPLNDSPKAPPSRITMTMPVINNAHNVVFAIMGSDKAAIIKRVLIDKEDLPATRVNPTTGKLLWIMDDDAGHFLPNERVG